MVLGHEAAGRGRGDRPRRRRPRQGRPRRFWSSSRAAGIAAPCAGGRPALCEPACRGKRCRHAALRCAPSLPAGGAALNHHLGVSGFAEYATVSRRSLIRIDKDVPLDLAALFGCAVLTGVGAVVNTAHVAAGSTVAVVGLGGVGLAARLGAIAAGAERVLAVDLAPDKLQLAAGLGATDTFNAGDADAVDKIREATRGGVDVALEMAGSVPALQLAYRITRRGGTTVTAGLPAPAAMLSIPAVSLVAEERTLKGCYIGTSVPSRDLPRYLALFRRRAFAHRSAADPSPAARRHQRRLRPAARGPRRAPGPPIRVRDRSHVSPSGISPLAIHLCSLACTQSRQPARDTGIYP